ncbi:MAG: 5-amino-6-(D-ribitylamino)uracil--L-tyrosine 4-hydroxyphenyl transferase CofH [Alphaproteobacteria bacterium]
MTAYATQDEVLSSAVAHRLAREQAFAFVDSDADCLLRAAAGKRDAAHGSLISYSKKVFIPLTQLCRDICHYCTFARPPRHGEAAYLKPDQVLAIACAGLESGCKEALFTLGDKPELRYASAKEELDRAGYASTLGYLADMAGLVLEKTGLLPHVNPGLLAAGDVAALRRVSVSQGIMLESASERLCRRGGPHFGSPDKQPFARLETIRLAGAQNVPFTSGILIGIGETRSERIEALLALRDLNDAHGHIQEIIIQNFRPKPGTRMANWPGAALEEHLWTIAVARLLFEPGMNVQAPPNLNPEALTRLIEAGINDWGGVSPVTPDHVNPEAPWPEIERLRAVTEAAGKQLAERLAIYPAYAQRPDRWLDRNLVKPTLDKCDAGGLARTDSWCPGAQLPPPQFSRAALGRPGAASRELDAILEKPARGVELVEADIIRLFHARGATFEAVCDAADGLRRAINGDCVTYVVNRNINYTNICSFKCHFCAFSKGKQNESLRGRAYDLSLDQVVERARVARGRGATEVCMQGGIHPAYGGHTYLELCRAVKNAVPDIHIHAFSPLEIHQGAETLGIGVRDFLLQLKDIGLGTLPGTAAEILDDEVRRVICPDKLDTSAWLEVVRTAHAIGLRSTATIMFGHVDGYQHWARHLLRVRDLQKETGGFTEFVPLPFVPMQTPLYLKGGARPGPTFREAVLMHAVARLVLHPHVTNIQASWVKMGASGTQACLCAGANDVGGTLMNESISRSAGASHGQEMTVEDLADLIRAAGRFPQQRTTLYDPVAPRMEPAWHEIVSSAHEPRFQEETT